MGILSFFVGPIGRYVTAAAALLGLFWWVDGRAHHAGYKAGIAAQVAVDSKAMGVAQVAADKRSALLQAQANLLESDRDKARNDLDEYRLAHPVHLFVQHGQACGAGRVPEAASPSTAGTAPTGVLQPQPASDVGPALDLKAAEADGWIEQYRKCRTAYIAAQ